MKKSLFLAGLTVFTLSVWGMDNNCITPNSSPKAENLSRRIDMPNTSASLTASPMVFPENQQAVSMEKLKEVLKLPEYPEGYEEDFFNAIETDLNIDKVTAKDIIVSWRGLELEAFRSVIGLTEEKLNEWRKSGKYLVQSKDPIFKDLLTKIREKKDELHGKYKELSTKDNIRKLIEYHDFMLIRLDNSCSSFYNMAMYCNNDGQKSKKAISWLENHNLTERMHITDGEREDILSQIIEGKQFEEIQEIYSKLQKHIYDEHVRFIKYWFLFPEQDLFKEKIKGNELDKELKPLALERSELDTNALADLIRLGYPNFVEQYKDYDYMYYQYIASVWKVLADKNFEKPNWCNEDAISEQRLETSKRRVESVVIAKSVIRNARNYLKFVDKDLPVQGRPNKQQNVISFYKWKLDEYENTDPKKSIRGTKSEFKKNAVYEEVRKYFGLNGRDIRRIFEPYRAEIKKLKELKVNDKEEYDRILNEKRREYQAIPAKDIAFDVNTVVGKSKPDVLSNIISGNKVDPEVQSESQEIIRNLWEMGFSYERIIELLGLKDDFEKNCHSTAENLTDSSSDTGSSSSSSIAQTRKRKADSDVESTSFQKRNKRNEPMNPGS